MLQRFYLLRLLNVRTGRFLGAPVFGVMLNMFVCGCALNWNAFGTGAAAGAPPKAYGLLPAVGVAGVAAPPKLNAFAGSFAVLPPNANAPPALLLVLPPNDAADEADPNDGGRLETLLLAVEPPNENAADGGLFVPLPNIELVGFGAEVKALLLPPPALLPKTGAAPNVELGAGVLV